MVIDPVPRNQGDNVADQKRINRNLGYSSFVARLPGLLLAMERSIKSHAKVAFESGRPSETNIQDRRPAGT
jgi:hypothetical protein